MVLTAARHESKDAGSPENFASAGCAVGAAAPETARLAAVYPQAAQQVAGKEARLKHRGAANQQAGNERGLNDRSARHDGPERSDRACDARPKSRARKPTPRGRENRQRVFSLIIEAAGGGIQAARDCRRHVTPA